MTRKIDKDRTSRLKPVYLRYSSDRFMLDDSVKKLKQGYFLGEELELNVNEFYASETSLEEIVNICQTLSFFPEKRLVIVWEVEKMEKTDPSGFKKLLDYVADPSENTVLLLVALLKKRDNEPAAAFKRRQAHFLQLFEGTAEKKELVIPDRQRFPDWVRKEFIERGKVISPLAAKYLVDRLGSDLYTLVNEIEKISLYYADRQGLEIDDIRGLISQSVAGNIYDLVDAVSQRDMSQALDLLNHFIQSDEEAMRLLFALLRQVRSLLRTKVLHEKGDSDSELARKLGIQSWLVKKYREQSQKFSLEELKQALACLLEAEVSIKTGKKTSKAALEKLVIEIVGDKSRKQEGARKTK